MMKDIFSRMQNTITQYRIESTTFYKLSRFSQNPNIYYNIIYFIILELYLHYNYIVIIYDINASTYRSIYYRKNILCVAQLENKFNVRIFFIN